MSNQMLPQYSTIKFTDVWDDVESFMDDFHNNGIPYQYTTYKINQTTGEEEAVTTQTISDTSAQTLFYLLYARYGNNPIANRDVNQFKYKVFSVIFQYGPTWEKRLDVQGRLRQLNLGDIRAGAFAMYNQAQNPATAPSTDTTDELTYINGQNTTRYTKSPLEGYSILLELLDTDVTEDFLKKFNICFKKFVSSERPLIYVSEEDEDDGN